jgi:hypothetical protein
MDFEVERPTRHCAVSGRALAEGETFYSVLRRAEKGYTRIDCSAEAWTGPSDDVVAWWKSQVQAPAVTKPPPTPSEVLLKLFDDLESSPEQIEMRYVLALLMVRRRIFKLDESAPPPPGTRPGQTLAVHCARREATYHVAVANPDARRVVVLQDELSLLLSPAPTATPAATANATTSETAISETTTAPGSDVRAT